MLIALIALVNIVLIPSGSQASRETVMKGILMSLKSCIAFVLFCSLSFAATTKTPPVTAKRDAIALSILGSSLTAMGVTGGPAATSMAVGTITYADGKTGTMTVKSLGVDHVRHDLVIGGETLSYVIKDGQGYLLKGGKKHKLPLWITAHKGPEHIPAFSRIGEYLLPNRNVEFLGDEDVNGRTAHHLKLSAFVADDPAAPGAAKIEADISEMHIFVDAKNSTVVKMQNFVFSPETPVNRSVAETYYSDYSAVNGILVPHHLIRYVGGQKDSEITFTSVSVVAA